MTDDIFLLADFIGRWNWPTLSFVWHPLYTPVLYIYNRHTPAYSVILLSDEWR